MTPNSSKLKHQDKNEGWKAFKHDTEAGRLLSRLYGVQCADPKINYPKLKCNKGSISNSRQPWNKPKTQHKEKKQVNVPKVGRPNMERKLPPHIFSVPRRKTESLCQDAIQNSILLSKQYRPPTNIINGELEKERLNSLHTYGGGRALPEELTMPKQSRPKDTNIVKKDECESRQKSLSDQIVNEIKERQEFQMTMEEMNAGEETRDKIMTEISVRMKELMKIDQSKARELLK